MLLNNKTPLNLKKTFIILVSIIVLVGGFFTYELLPADNSDTSIKHYQVAQGETFNHFLNTLEKDHVIKSYNALKLVQVLSNLSLKKGEYDLSPSMNGIKLLDILDTGSKKLYSLTFPEGFSILDMYDTLRASQFKKAADGFLGAVHNPSLIEKYQIPATSLEGYLFPSTYYISKDISAEKLVSLMVDTFFEKIATIKDNANKDSLYKRVTLASIIEKEAVIDKDRPLIASVFLNRVKKGMRLESCATIIYIFQQQGVKKNKVYFKDLQIDSPYNSYRHKGLTPGPISSPGLKSLQAAFNPADTDYLFFVYKGNGAHLFSSNYKDHMKAYNKYIKYQYTKKK